MRLRHDTGPADAALDAQAMIRLDRKLRAGVNTLYTAATVEISLWGTPVYVRSYGLLDPEDPHSATSRDSIFDIASITKVFTAVAFMRLVERGKVSLDTPVKSVVPEFEGRWKDEVTFCNLLTHTSGAPTSLKSAISRSAVSSPGDIKRAVFESPLQRRPRQAVIYSDLNFVILGEATERLAGAPLSSIVSREVTEPLGMANTFYNPPPDVLHKIATTSRAQGTTCGFLRGVVHDPTARFLGGVSGHAGLFSCVQDLTKLVSEFLRDVPGHGFLQQHTVRLMTGERAAIGRERRGLGWALNSGGLVPGRGFGPSSFGHNGFTGGSIWVDPVDGLAVVMLTNRVYFNEEKTWRPFSYFRNRVHSLAKRLVGSVPKAGGGFG